VLDEAAIHIVGERVAGLARVNGCGNHRPWPPRHERQGRCQAQAKPLFRSRGGAKPAVFYVLSFYFLHLKRTPSAPSDRGPGLSALNRSIALVDPQIAVRLQGHQNQLPSGCLHPLEALRLATGLPPAAETGRHQVRR